MAGDLTGEWPVIPLRDVPRLPGIGPRRGGARLNLRTVFRWAGRGASGVVLETVVQGGQRYTSGPALARFFAAVTAARSRGMSVSRSGRPSERDPAGVEAELDRLGI